MSIVEKPWGYEEILETNDAYVVKKLHMRRGQRCSLQYHRKKRETIFVLSGRLKIISGPSAQNLTEHIYQAHQFITIPPKMVHRMEALEDCIYLESSSPQLTDVVRIQDDYQRA